MNLHLSLRDISSSSMVSDSLGLYHFLQFQIKGFQTYLNAAMWSVYERNFFVSLFSSNLRNRQISSNLSSDMVTLYIGLENLFPNKSQIGTSQYFLQPARKQPLNQQNVFPWIHFSPLYSTICHFPSF